MPKPDFPALLPPGMHSKSIQDLYDLAVAPFQGNAQREDLFRKFSAWSGSLRAEGVTGVIWIDGSFLTSKPNPSDIDCVVWSPGWGNPAAVTTNSQNTVMQLFDHATAESIFGLDLYVERPAADRVFHREAYWRGILGFCHDRITAKGFAEVIL